MTIDDGLVTNSGSGGTLTMNGSTPLAFAGGTLNTGSGTLALTASPNTIGVSAADQARLVFEHPGFSIVETFNLQQRAGPARFIARTWLAQH